jgi:hypothetical protein
VWRVAAALGGLLLTGVAVWLLIPREYYTGTNSVRTRGMVATVDRGERLCVRGLQVPAGTERLQLEVASRARRPALLGRVIAGGRVSTASAPGSPEGGQEKVAFRIAPRPEGGHASAPGSICVTHAGAGPVAFGGTEGLQSDDVAPTLDDRELDKRIAVWFLPEEGAKSAPLRLLPDLFERAALFRPGVVGPWTYWVLVFLVLPALMYWAIRLLAVSNAPRASGRRLSLSLFLLAFLSFATWALITPSFNAPDESEHFAYAQYVAETGRAVEASQGSRPTYSGEEAAALEGTRLFSSSEQKDGRPPWLKADEQRWKHNLARGLNGEDDGGGFAPATSSHSPAYYALLAPAYLATDSQSTFSQLAVMRLISALLGAVVVLCAFFVVRELVPRHPAAAVAAALLVALQPMFGFMSGAVNNDMGVNAASAVLIYLLVRGLRRVLTPPLGAAIGAALVIAPLLKGTALALYPAAAIALVLMLWRQRHALPLPGLAAVVGTFLVLTLGWDLVAPTFERPTLTTPGGEVLATNARNDIEGTFAYIWQVFLPRLPTMPDLFVQRWPAFDIYVERGWGAFGWYAVLFPRWVYLVILVTMLAVAGLAVTAVLRNRTRAWQLAPSLVVLVVAILGLVGGVHASFYSPVPRPLIPEFGRYAFAVIVPLAALVAAALFALPRRLLVSGAAVLVVLMLGLSYASRLLTLYGFYS